MRLLSRSLLCCCLVLPPLFAESGGTPLPSMVPAGVVRATEVVGNVAYLGGDFDYIGWHKPGWAMLVGDEGRPRHDFPAISGDVQRVIADGAGGWFVAGAFSAVGTEALGGLVQVKSDGTVQQVAHIPHSLNIRDLLLRDRTLYVVGPFGTINGFQRGGGAAIDLDTDAVLPWDPQSDGSIEAIADFGDRLYLGGSFREIGGRQRRNLAAVDPQSGMAIATWTSEVSLAVRALQGGDRW